MFRTSVFVGAAACCAPQRYVFFTQSEHEPRGLGKAHLADFGLRFVGIVDGLNFVHRLNYVL